MTSKEDIKKALDGLAQFIIMNDTGTDESASAIEWHGILEQASKELERLKKFKETFDNYELLLEKQGFIAYENWQECERELTELKQLLSKIKEIIDRQDDSYISSMLEESQRYYEIKELMNKELENE